MARRPNIGWSDEEIAALARLGPYERGASIRFHETYPYHSLSAIRAKLLVLRLRGQADDITHTRDDPFPAYR
jgi:hypothetical protein